MKQTIKLALSYQKRHKKQFVTSALCIAFFIAAMLSMQLFQICFADWQQKLRAEQYGAYSLSATNAELARVDKSAFPDGGLIGFMAATNQIDCPGASPHMTPYLGFMEAECAQMLNASLVEGAWPNAQGQAAIEQTAYDTMGLSAKVGETVTLPVIVDGDTVQQSFLLTGIISPYRQTWQNAESNLEAPVPTVVTVPGEAPLPVGHVLMEKTPQPPWPDGMLSGAIGENISYLFPQNHDANQLQIMGNVLTALFVFLLVVGILNVVNSTLADRSRYTGLLRCIGATKKQAFQVFLLQGLGLTAVALLLGYGLGLFLLWLAILVFRAFGFDFSFILSPLPFAVITPLSLAAILVPYLVQIRRFLQGEPLRLGQAQSRRRNRKMGKGDFSAVWFRAKKPALRMQNLLTVLLAAGSMMLLAFGPFYADYIAYGSYVNQESEMDSLGISYWMGLRNGGSDMEKLQIEIPRNKGVTREMMEKLEQSPDLRVDFSGITFNAAAYLFTSDKDTDSPTGRLRENYSILNSVEEKERPHYLTDLGYPAGSEVLNYPIVGLSSAQLSPLVSGGFDKAAYDSGQQVVAVGGNFQVGDQLTVSIAALPADYPLSQDDRIPEIHNLNVTVGALCQPDENGSIAEKRLLRYEKQMLLISDQVLLQYDPSGNYDDVCISLVNAPLGKEAQAQTDALIQDVQAKSRSVSIWDRAAMEQEKQQLIWQLKLPYLFMIVLFLTSVMIALFLTTSIKVKSSLRSFGMLRAIGLEEKQLNHLLFYSNFRPCLLGMGIGTVAGLGLCMSLQQIAAVSGASYMLQSSLPAVLIGGVCIMLFCALACLHPKKWVIRQGIVQSLQNPTY